MPFARMGLLWRLDGRLPVSGKEDTLRVAVSACLLGVCCKYSGGSNACPSLIDALRAHDVIAVCPEVLGGLSIPRPPAEIADGMVRTVDGVSVDLAFRRGVERALAQVDAAGGCDIAILQPRSPSCGVHEVYDGSFSGTLVTGSGLFAQALAARGVPCYEPSEALQMLSARFPNE